VNSQALERFGDEQLLALPLNHLSRIFKRRQDRSPSEVSRILTRASALLPSLPEGALCKLCPLSLLNSHCSP
jgi:hypothetical protein